MCACVTESPWDSYTHFHPAAACCRVLQMCVTVCVAVRVAV